MQTAFGQRILAERTRALAERGVVADATLLPPHLVCIAGGRQVALPMALVASIRPSSHQDVPLLKPRAAGTVLGVALFGHRLASVLDLGRLLSLGDDAGGDERRAGRMVLLRTADHPVAVRVDEVLGVMPLRPTEEADRALLASKHAPGAFPELVTVVEAGRLAALIASLDDG